MISNKPARAASKRDVIVTVARRNRGLALCKHLSSFLLSDNGKRPTTQHGFSPSSRLTCTVSVRVWVRFEHIKLANRLTVLGFSTRPHQPNSISAAGILSHPIVKVTKEETRS